MPEINDNEEIPEGNFPINLKLIKEYQRKEPSLMDKYKDGTHHKGYFGSGIIIDINLIMCEDRIFISSILQSYVLHWYHKHIFYTGMNKMIAMFFQTIYWPGIRYAIRR